MSAIRAALAEATGLSIKKDEDEKDYQARLIRGVMELSDEQWAALDVASQNWFNDAADKVNKKEAFPDFPDAEPPAKAPARRAVAAPAPAAVIEPAVGDTVKITTKRKMEKTGIITEMDDDVIVLDGADEISFASIADIEVLSAGGGGVTTSEEPLPAIEEPEVGDTIEAVTKRGMTKTGEVLAVEEGLVVIKTKDGEDEIDTDKLESLKVTKKAGGRGGRTARTATAPVSTAAENKRTTKAENGGVSATLRMRQLIISDFAMKEEDVGKVLKKEGLQFKDNTLSLVYAEAHRLISMLKDAGKLK